MKGTYGRQSAEGGPAWLKTIHLPAAAWPSASAGKGEPGPLLLHLTDIALEPVVPTGAAGSRCCEGVIGAMSGDAVDALLDGGFDDSGGVFDQGVEFAVFGEDGADAG